MPTKPASDFQHKGYAPRETFRELKKRILSNAHAYYAHHYAHSERFDVITSSTTPTGRLDSTQWRAALIVYPDPKCHNWQMLYKSSTCPSVEDAAFEVKYWIEEDMTAVFDRMEEGDIWAAELNRTAPNGPWKTKGMDRSNVEKMRAEKSGVKTGSKDKVDESETEKSVDTEVRAARAASDLKRKSRAKMTTSGRRASK